MTKHATPPLLIDELLEAATLTRERVDRPHVDRATRIIKKNDIPCVITPANGLPHLSFDGVIHDESSTGMGIQANHGGAIPSWLAVTDLRVGRSGDQTIMGFAYI